MARRLLGEGDKLSVYNRKFEEAGCLLADRTAVVSYPADALARNPK
jgi:hypothetical protein